MPKSPSVPLPFWSRDANDLLASLGSSRSGLSETEAGLRLERDGPNLLRPPRIEGAFRLFLRQFGSPIAVLLFIAATLSGLVGEGTDAVIILAILLGSGWLGFWQERTASRAVRELLALIRVTATVRRDQAERDIPTASLVAGDLIALNAGDLVPADCRLLEARDLAVDESALTGESFPASKGVEPVPADSPLGARSSALFLGSHVVAGTGLALVVVTGPRTQYGTLASELARRPPESEFERGVRRFGVFLLQVTILLVLVIFALNVALRRPWLDTFLFTLALAVGLTPQLLPAIVSVTLSYGARRMARRQVVVRRLVAIQDFGGMSVLCTDKTGTLTLGAVQFHAAFDPEGNPSDPVRRLGCLNAALQAGYENPLDRALRGQPLDLTGIRKLDEIPYDFERRRLSVLVDDHGQTELITKGAVEEVLAVSTLEPEAQSVVRHRVADLGGRGLRCMAVARRALPGASEAKRDDEAGLTFQGILVFRDPPKPGIRETLGRLRDLGIELKMVTGDNVGVAMAVARESGLKAEQVVTGGDLRGMTEEALRRRVKDTEVFAEIDPNQKVRIVRALKAGGISVGFLGDGINDAAALHAADVGISVDTAVDVTKEAASIVLLRKDLEVIAEGVREGRRAFANTLKYIFITTSASFGNMFTMAGASLLVPFLPMLPKQILLLNLLSDLPAMAIATDRVDPELVARPRRWDLRAIRNFMLVFGISSSLFDYLTFGFLLLMAVPLAQFRTGWFVESLLTEVLVLLVIRTRRPFFRSGPSGPLLASSIAIAGIAVGMAVLPTPAFFGFSTLSLPVVGGLVGLAFLLVVASEAAKRVLPAVWADSR